MDENQEKDPVVRSEEIQEIITQVPSWMSRWGITFIFCWIILLFVLSWVIKYPDVIQAEVVITTSPPPLTLQARTAGTIRLVTPENQHVKKGDIIAYIKSNASIDDVLRVEAFVESGQGELSPKASGDLLLGDLQSLFTSYTNATHELETFRSLRIADKQIRQLQTQVQSYQQLRRTLHEQHKLAGMELKLAVEKFRRDSTLYTQRVLSKLDFNNAEALYLQEKRNFRTSESALVSNEIQINTLNAQISQLSLGDVQERGRLESNVVNTRNELIAGIKKWKETYLFIAPQDGAVAYLKFLDNDMQIPSGEPLLSILPAMPQGVPSPERQLYAQAKIPVAGSGKVVTGQSVNIRLKNFPHQQFGMLKGQVVEISALPTEETYLAKITLTNNLVTTHRKELPFKQQLQGQTEIITEELTVLERIMYQFRSLLSSQS